jgi:hypothetical protein
MKDPTEDRRRQMLESGQPAKDLEAATQRWNTDELTRDFIVRGFMAPYVIVIRKSDGASGSLEFTHSPRWYFNWKEDDK